MPHTQAEINAALDRIENLDPDTAEWVDATPLREITSATEAIRANQAKQREAVQIARARGISWNLIAVALGVSRQAARERFASQTRDPNQVSTKKVSAGRRVKAAS
jgi:hypothetical protein